MLINEFSTWFSCYQEQALILNERRLIVLVGNNQWASNLLTSIDSNSCNGAEKSSNTWLIYGEGTHIKPTVVTQRFRDKLGTESNFVVFQDTQLSIDALAALSGTLISGGIFFLLIENKSNIDNSLFYQRFFKLINTYSEHQVISEEQLELPDFMHLDRIGVHTNKFTSIEYQCATQEQLIAVEAIIKVVKGKRNIPLVLTADRGRGKSSALAIACAQLFNLANDGHQFRIVITASDFGSLTVFFNQLQSSCPNGELTQGKFVAEYGTVEFIPIDQLLRSPEQVSLMLVDEAASIPVHLLEQLLSYYSRLVFASTMHGYEGAGRGFTLKFQQKLKQKCPQNRTLHIHEPIRWRTNDPLEALIFDACLLNAELPTYTEDQITKQFSSFEFREFTALELADNEKLLRQVFSVLVTAHYQTKPSDVKMLLDNKSIKLVCLLSEKLAEPQVIAVAMLMNEGNIEGNNINDEAISSINNSTRRLKNNFIPQSLLTQCSVNQAFNFHYLRVMRIAVHPQLQQRGIGQYFIEKITDFSKAQGADFLASSFGASKRLLSFWLMNDFKIARIGFKKDKASGEQSALVLKALSHQGITLLDDVNDEFYRSFDYLLTDEYQELSAELVALILTHCLPSQCLTLTERDKLNIEGFSLGNKQYSNCVFSLHLWLKLQFSNSYGLNKKDSLVFISRTLQKHSIEDVCKLYGFTGKKALEHFLREKVQMALNP